MVKHKQPQKPWHVYDDCLDPIATLLEQYVTGKIVPGSVDIPTGQEMTELLEECKLDFAIAWLKVRFPHEVANEVNQIIGDSARDVKFGSFNSGTKFRVGQLRALARAIQEKINQED